MNAEYLLGFGRDLGARFNLTALLPMALLALFGAALICSGAPGSTPQPREVLARAQGLNAWSAALLALVVLVVTLLALPFQLRLVRLLEGYWGTGRLGTRLYRMRCRAHEQRLKDLEKELRTPVASEADAMQLQQLLLQRDRSYPQDRLLLMPTLLGNALRSAEERAGRDYALDVVVTWPRLYPCLGANTRALVDDRRDQLDLSARMSAVFLSAAILAAALLAAHGGWWLLLVPACLALSWLSYRGAVANAIGYGEALRTAVDLHRFDMLTALHLPLPGSRAVELRTNRQLIAFLRDDELAFADLQGEAPEKALDFRYSHAPGGTAPADGYPTMEPDERAPS